MAHDPSPHSPHHSSVLETSFSKTQIAQQLADDREAWRGIMTILIGIVTFGISLAAVVVWAISRWV